MSNDARTLATEVREMFEWLASEPNMSMENAVVRIANMSSDTEEFHVTLGKMKAKCEALRTQIEVSSLKQNSKNLYLNAIQDLSGFLTLDKLVRGSNDQLRGRGQSFEYLMLLDDILEPLENRVVSEEILTDLMDKAKSILAELVASGIEPRLKSFLEEQIRKFMWSIDTFHTFGIEGLTKAWGAMMAEVVRSQGMEGATKPEAKKWYSKALPMIGTIGLVVTTVSTVVEKTDNLLTHGASIFAFFSSDDVTNEGQALPNLKSPSDFRSQFGNGQIALSPPSSKT